MKLIISLSTAAVAAVGVSSPSCSAKPTTFCYRSGGHSGAWLYLRDALGVANTERFPEATYGTAELSNAAFAFGGVLEVSPAAETAQELHNLFVTKRSCRRYRRYDVVNVIA